MANTHSTLASLFTDIANSIRGKKGSTGKITADNFPSEIDSIEVGVQVSGTLVVVENGTYNVRDKESVQVNVPQPSGQISITSNGTHNVSGKATAVVNVPTTSGYVMKTGTLEGGATSFNTGLKSVKSFTVSRQTNTGTNTGLTTATYTEGVGCLYEYINTYNNMLGRICILSADPPTINGGTVTLAGTSGTNAPSSSLVYNWVAFGTE